VVDRGTPASPVAGENADSPVEIAVRSITISTVELKERPTEPTLARRLGEVPHVSGLLRRIARISSAGERVADWLLKIAVERGARHLERAFDPTLPGDCPDLADEELGVALCLGELPYDLDRLRAAAQLLSSPAVDAPRLCRLAVQERCEPVFLHIARLAERFAPDLHPWAFVRRHLPARPVPRTEALPHWTRLVSYTGVSGYNGSPRADWLRRHE
jgi:hypothetical protein